MKHIKLVTDMSRPPHPFRHKSGIYYIRMRILGKDVWRSLHTTVRRDAEILAYQQWYAVQQPEVQAIICRPETKLANIWLEYEGTDDYKNLEVTSLASRRNHWFAFLKFAERNGIDVFEDITPQFAESFLNTRGTAAKTYNNIRSSLIKIFSRTCRRYQRPNVFEQVERKMVSRKIRPVLDYRAFSDSEILKIMESLKTCRLRYREEWLRACEIARYTGLRYKDIALLSWFAVKGDYIETIPHKTANKTGGKSVLIKISPSLRAVLTDIPKEGEYILPNLAKSYLSALRKLEHTDESCATVNETRPFSGLLSRLGICGNGSKVGFHSFRSTVITKLRAAGIDAKLIGGMVGHTSEKQTEHYNKNSLTIDVACLKYQVEVV